MRLLAASLSLNLKKEMRCLKTCGWRALPVKFGLLETAVKYGATHNKTTKHNKKRFFLDGLPLQSRFEVDVARTCMTRSWAGAIPDVATAMDHEVSTTLSWTKMKFVCPECHEDKERISSCLQAMKVAGSTGLDPSEVCSAGVCNQAGSTQDALQRPLQCSWWRTMESTARNQWSSKMTQATQDFGRCQACGVFRSFALSRPD
eukprot:s890_g34.t2